MALLQVLHGQYSDRTVDFSIQVEAASIVAKNTGDDGHQLLEFGNYYDLSWGKLNKWNKAEHVHFIGSFIVLMSTAKYISSESIATIRLLILPVTAIFITTGCDVKVITMPRTSFQIFQM